MSENSANSKRIAKNTLMLYFRMLFLMGVSLYTSRIILANLGVEDYGIYNVVGGVVAMFTMISGSLSSAISRFITFELGKGSQEKLNIIFSTSVIIQIIIGVIIVILVETVGVWFLANKMVIPADRLFAAKWVLRFSLIALIINLISIPYNAAIIAHERMSAFAYISILEASGKLAIAYLITISPIDKLILYAILMASVALVVRFTYSIYCRRHFEECKFRLVFDKLLLKDMFGFAGWNFIGSSSALLRDQGGNMLLNVLGGGPAVNAARGISSQVNTAIHQFSSNFMMAMNPQITKSYASGDHKYMMTLMFQGARLSFYMLLTLSLPVIISAPYVLELWLRTVPEYTVTFVRLVLILGMCEAISTPLITAMLATGNIKSYQIVVGGLQMMNLPISYIMLKLGFFPPIVLIVAIFVSMCCLASRLYMLRGMIGLPIRTYLSKVYFNVLTVAIISAIIPYFARLHIEDDFIGFVVVSLLCVLSTFSVIYIIGCSKDERIFVNGKVSQVINKVSSR